MTLATEPIGSVPRSRALQEGMQAAADGQITSDRLESAGNRRIFVGVIDPIDPHVETPEEVRDRILQAARFIDPSHLGTTDDCGFSPFGDDSSTSRDIAFAKIQARIDGTAMASTELGV